MREIIPDVYIMEGLRGANVYLLQSPDGAVAVDSGIRADAERIIAQVAQANAAPPNVSSIVITHFHGDHAGGAAKLSEHWGAQVLAHRQDAPYISNPNSIPAFSNIKQLVNWVGAAVILRSPCRVNRVVEDGDRIEALEGCVIVHTPGHTPGSISLYQPERQILFCGDAIFTENPLTQKPGMGLYLRGITLDNAQAQQSLRKLSRLPIKVLCCGHGEPLMEGVNEQMEELLAHYQANRERSKSR